MPVIVLAGMIAAGKSTVSARLAKELKTELMIEPVDQNPILPLYYKDDVNNPSDWDEVYSMIMDAFDESISQQN